MSQTQHPTLRNERAQSITRGLLFIC